MGKRSTRGHVNAILDQLLGEGVIAGFETKQDSDYALVRRLRVFVVPGSNANPDAAKRTVMTALEGYSDRVSVRVKAAYDAS